MTNTRPKPPAPTPTAELAMANRPENELGDYDSSVLDLVYDTTRSSRRGRRSRATT